MTFTVGSGKIKTEVVESDLVRGIHIGNAKLKMQN